MTAIENYQEQNGQEDASSYQLDIHGNLFEFRLTHRALTGCDLAHIAQHSGQPTFWPAELSLPPLNHFLSHGAEGGT